MTFTAAGIALSVETKATTDNNWEGVQTVAVKVGDEMKPYTVNPSGDYQTATLTSDDPFYWQNTAPIQVSAWWPYTDGSTTMPAVVVQANQSEVGNFHKSDYICAENQQVEFGGTQTLQFTHRTAKVVVEPLEPGNGMSDTELQGATVALVGVTTGSADNATVTPYADGTNLLALLPEQQIAADEPFIRISLANGTTYSYKPDEAITLQAGRQYTYTITVNKTGLGMSNVAISNWDNTNPPIEGDAMPDIKEIDLATVTESQLTVSGKTTIKGDGTTPKDLQITVEADAKVTLENVVLQPSAIGNAITCNGDATITLVGNNNLTAKSNGNVNTFGSGIYVKSGTLTINGNGSLNISREYAASDYWSVGAGIGAGNGANILIESGDISISDVPAAGSSSGAGIGSTTQENCGNITIKGGTIRIGKPSWRSACIGSATYTSCGDITISGESTVITFTKGDYAPCGIGNGDSGTCGTVTVGGGATVNDVKYTETHTGTL